MIRIKNCFQTVQISQVYVGIYGSDFVESIPSIGNISKLICGITCFSLAQNPIKYGAVGIIASRISMDYRKDK